MYFLKLIRFLLTVVLFIYNWIHFDSTSLVSLACELILYAYAVISVKRILARFDCLDPDKQEEYRRIYKTWPYRIFIVFCLITLTLAHNDPVSILYAYDDEKYTLLESVHQFLFGF